MASPMTQAQLARLTALEPVLRAVFMDQIGLDEPLSLLNQLFNVQDSVRAVERTLGIGGLGDVPVYAGSLSYDSFETLYTALFTHEEYALGMAIERKAMDDDEYGVIQQQAQLMGLAFDRKIEKDAVSVFNNAFSGSHVGADGVALCSASHPRSPSDASTQSNLITTALTHDSLITARRTMMKFTDSRGNLTPSQGDTLIVPVELEATARTITESTLRSGTADNDANVNQGVRVVISPYLTDTNNWFLVDRRLAKLHLHWFFRVRPELMSDPAGDFDLVGRFRGYMRYSFGWDDWRWILGAQVTGS